MNGATILRVHDVKAAKEVAAVVDARDGNIRVRCIKLSRGLIVLRGGLLECNFVV